ncbi:putative mitochondrial protein [Cucumis melo var. makuwa]|uniref:Putative mitochondrial protein n=1 Tax=Cucumis melo var. makuwa TaxID=1194695 RepID=A0A5D3BCV9_CUCMM|nr:putative mitochondrial protein [Cucumis melo var. makuwa]
MDWSLTEPIRIKQALATPQWKQAMDEEYSALLKAQTWHLVPPSPSQKVAGKKWVFRLKRNTDGSIRWYKTRLVAKGFHQHLGVDFFETFSPVVKASTIRVILNLAVTNGWQLRQLDFNNAFLNGNLTKTVYIQKPPGYVHPSFPNYVCKLDKAIYGLKQSPRAWNETLSKKLFSWGFENSKSNSSLFILRCRSSIILLLVYVDDVVVTGNDTKLIDELKGTDLSITAYSDANWASNIDDRKSVAAYCVFICNNLVSWLSKKQTVVARSSTNSEYRALALAASEVILLKQLLFELNVNLPLKPVIWYDNVSAGTLATN